MAIGISAIISAAGDHALASGYFDQVNGHEPKNAPGHGLTGAVWVDTIRAVTSSGLASASAQVVLQVRLYTSMLQEPQDAIDPHMVDAVDALVEAYAGEFTLGGLVRNVDLLGAEGMPLQVKAGYINQDNRLFRVMTITLPVIVNDAWEEEA